MIFVRIKRHKRVINGKEITIRAHLRKTKQKNNFIYFSENNPEKLTIPSNVPLSYPMTNREKKAFRNGFARGYVRRNNELLGGPDAIKMKLIPKICDCRNCRHFVMFADGSNRGRCENRGSPNFGKTVFATCILEGEND